MTEDFKAFLSIILKKFDSSTHNELHRARRPPLLPLRLARALAAFIWKANTRRNSFLYFILAETQLRQELALFYAFTSYVYLQILFLYTLLHTHKHTLWMQMYM